MKTILSFIITVCIANLAFSQQMSNPSFEDWEDVGLGPDLFEPTHWSSIKTSDNFRIKYVCTCSLEQEQ